ncbi:MAG: aminotransferase class I/II-fold pyridoxal phosphate-dependent enzyme [Actinobacteria bacterium]|nr:MAG: aminotransferase class I/II-fold pyridoxal phosphate-dependent enzyme [Actinomycetota bacterium]
MPHDRLDEVLATEIAELEDAGTAKGEEDVIVAVRPPADGYGRRYVLQGGDSGYLRMNSNSYLGLSHHPAVIEAEERASREFGAGPGAVRFISGTYEAHTRLEASLSRFHGREAGIIYSSAYAAVLSTMTSLIDPETVVLSDELNHNCIINGVRMSKPAAREVYPHLDYDALDAALSKAAGEARRAIVVTDGVFSMRGDFADLSRIAEVARRHDGDFEENVVVIVDDSHGVGAFGDTGRGTEQVTGGEADVLIGTLGKAFGVNGGYVVGTGTLVRYLQERGPMYIYSNPITVGEAAAGEVAVGVLDSSEGQALLEHLRTMTTKFESGLVDLGLETIPGPHPVVPLMVRDTARTSELVRHLYDHGVLATGLNYPVVPKGDEEIRFQVNADHTPADIEYALEVLSKA